MQLMPLNQLVDVRFLDTPESAHARSQNTRDKKRAAMQLLTAAEIEQDVPMFFQTVKRAVLSSKVCDPVLLFSKLNILFWGYFDLEFFFL